MQDVVYYFAPADSGTITVSLCGSQSLNEAFDTKLYVLDDLSDTGASPAAAVACNDDNCGYLSELQVGAKVWMTAGCIALRCIALMWPAAMPAAGTSLVEAAVALEPAGQCIA